MMGSIRAPRVLQFSGGYLPWTVGGKEVYVHHLSRHLQEQGWAVRAVLHQNLNHHEPIGDRTWDDVPVTVLPPVSGQERRAAVYGCLPAAVPGYTALLDEFRPDIVHFHDFSVTVNLLHLRACRGRGVRSVMTYHSPGQSCLQRSLLYGGSTLCDGEIRPFRCTTCRLTAAGVPWGARHALTWFPGTLPLPADRLGGLGRSLTARAMTETFVRAWREMTTSVDRFAAHGRWVANLLASNGVPPNRVSIVPLGVPAPACAPTAARPAGGPLRVAFVGRCDEVKGVHVLVAAVRRLPPEIPVEVSFFGQYWDSDLGRRLLSTIAGDRRFRSPVLLDHARIAESLASIDLLAVPSIWPETGPLVVLEAFAAGVPVVGSRLGGIADLVRDGTDGLLVTPGSPAALAEAIATVASNRAALDRLRGGVRPPRRMADVATEIGEMYRRVLATETPHLVAAS